MAGKYRIIVGVTEIAERLSVSREWANTLVDRKGFPEPIAEMAMGRCWDLLEVEAWAREVGRL